MAVLEQMQPQVILSLEMSNLILTELYRALTVYLREHRGVLSLDRWFTELRNEVVHTSAR